MNARIILMQHKFVESDLRAIFHKWQIISQYYIRINSAIHIFSKSLLSIKINIYIFNHFFSFNLYLKFCRTINTYAGSYVNFCAKACIRRNSNRISCRKPAMVRKDFINPKTSFINKKKISKIIISICFTPF